MASTPNEQEMAYRPCVGIMLVNRDGKVFVGQRLDNVVEAWQMPQGGIDEGEDAKAAALRELGEETGIGPEHVEIIAKARDEHFYDLPPELLGKLWGGKYRGQRQYCISPVSWGRIATSIFRPSIPNFAAGNGPSLKRCRN